LLKHEPSAIGVETDQHLALRWLTLAAEAGDSTGQRNLAALYFKGGGIEQDQRRAADLYRAAACPATRSSSTTCWPVRAASISSSWWSRPTMA
jgi:hypothetical protein